jgi:hypothetical protein
MASIRSLFIRMCLWWVERDICFIQHQREMMLEHLNEARNQRMAWLAELDDIYMDRPC